jgi:aminodeoxyfutalosine synthase
MTILLENLIKNSNPLAEITTKILNNERLTKEDGLKLYKSFDILSIGALADFARIKRLDTPEEKADCEQRAQGKLCRSEESFMASNQADYVYWINNHHLNLTNICEGTCKFCAYRRKDGQDGAFLYTLEKAVEYLETQVSKTASEIHIVSALNTYWNLENCKKLLQECKKILPNTHIQAFTAVEIDYLAKLSGISTKEVLQELKDAGLGSLPGGGAEIFAENIRRKTCPDKISGEKWLEIMEIAHNLGLKSNATMLTGIGETCEDKIDHMLKIREVQDRTGGFMTFIPLFCHYENTELAQSYSEQKRHPELVSGSIQSEIQSEQSNAGKMLNQVQHDNNIFKQQTGIEILKDYAISRLMLDNVPHIKAFWIQIGTKLAQVTLSFGVDDLDGTVMEEKITHFAGAKTGNALTKDDLSHLIKRAGKIPVERDTVYNIVKVY